MSFDFDRDETSEVNNNILTTEFGTSHSILVSQMSKNEVKHISLQI